VGAEAHPDEIVRQSFRIGQMHLVAPFDVSSELTEMPTVYPLPRMPANLLGLVNLHGRILPLFDLAELFETEHMPREKRMLLVMGHGNDAAASSSTAAPPHGLHARRQIIRPRCRRPPPARARLLPGRQATPGSNSTTRNYSINS
jgi:hypothetical protein